MVSMQETAYPRLKSCPNYKELEKLFSPTSSEISWAKQKARTPFSQLGLLTLNILQEKQNWIYQIKKNGFLIIVLVQGFVKLL
ncbi:hypothetical protein ACH0R4_RS10290 [Bacillus cytotoxicus]|uniref:hypothetical protein n=1 Tax=Bacillus cereus group sp. BfR-BA-01492 TaxID=2920361 RepID=UPI001F58B314|nr:hypothetical protein [Bacillus cereus group sp. BfR-BA-01492]